jgi:hypothetical protein
MPEAGHVVAQPAPADVALRGVCPGDLWLQREAVTMPLFPGRIPLAAHLGLYNAFHQAPGNKLVHTIASPFVYLSALVLVQVVVPAVVVPFVLVTLVLLALADWRSTLVYGLGIAVAVVAAVMMSRVLPAMPLALGALAVQGLAWAALIFIGHDTYEPPITVDGRPESTGLYFRRNYNCGRNLGVRPNAFDVFLQFSIAPLAHTNDLLFALGIGKDLEADMVAERSRVLEHLAAGRAPFADFQARAASSGGLAVDQLTNGDELPIDDGDERARDEAGDRHHGDRPVRLARRAVGGVGHETVLQQRRGH